MLVLILAFTAAARRQRGSPSGQLQAAKATAAGEVGGDICPMQVCAMHSTAAEHCVQDAL